MVTKKLQISLIAFLTLAALGLCLLVSYLMLT